MSDLDALIAAIHAQTDAINRLVAVNDAILHAVLEDAGIDEGDLPVVGLNGRSM